MTGYIDIYIPDIRIMSYIKTHMSELSVLLGHFIRDLKISRTFRLLVFVDCSVWGLTVKCTVIFEDTSAFKKSYCNQLIVAECWSINKFQNCSYFMYMVHVSYSAMTYWCLSKMSKVIYMIELSTESYCSMLRYIKVYNQLFVASWKILPEFFRWTICYIV